MTGAVLSRDDWRLVAECFFLVFIPMVLLLIGWLLWELWSWR
jgi:hypothetical protein